MPLGSWEETLGHGAARLNGVVEALKKFAPGDVSAACKFVVKRRVMLLRPVAVLANMLNPRCRGILLKEEERASALKVLGSFSEELGNPAPSVDEVLEFTQCRGAFVGVGDLQCTCFNLWSAVFPTTSLSPLAKLLSTLPCSQASVERVFSAADWAVDNREMLGFDNLR